MALFFERVYEDSIKRHYAKQGSRSEIWMLVNKDYKLNDGQFANKQPNFMYFTMFKCTLSIVNSVLNRF